MLAILKPVFESIWKRKETKIFIGLALIVPSFFLISTLLPEGHNFYGINPPEDGAKMGASTLISMMISSSSGIFLPIISLFYLTYTVFRGEADARTLFLYKDIKRADVFWAKFLSLIGIIILHTSLIFVVGWLVFYTRIVHLDYASPNFWSQNPTGNYEFIQTLFGESFNMIVCVAIAAFLSLKKGLGVTMATSFIYIIVAVIINNVFELSIILPFGDRNAIYDGGNFYLIFATSALVTLIYSSGLAHLTLKHFKGMEF